MCKKCEVMAKLMDDVSASEGKLMKDAAKELQRSLVVSVHMEMAARAVLDEEHNEEERSNVPFNTFILGYLLGQRLALQESFEGATPDYEDLDSTKDEADGVIRMMRLDDGGPGPDDKIN